jgi:cobalt-zinc-cadmium efflux system membrane fusion protein
MGFCREHRVPEAICALCRSDLEPTFRGMNDWCEGHGVPESQCEACNPGVLEQYAKYDKLLVDAVLPAGGVGTGSGIEVVRSTVPRILRGPSLQCANEQSVVRFAHADLASIVGLDFARAQRAPLRRSLSLPAELQYDARRHAILAPRAPGHVIEVRKGLGDRVVVGEVLVVVDSAVLGAARSEVLQAAARVELWDKNHDRERGLLEKGLTTEKEVIEAATQLAESRISLEAAEQRLRTLGLDEARIRGVRGQRDNSGRLEVLAPFAGVVTELRAVVGQIADPASPLVSVADT